jgi:beta-carotene 3-hydroxylase
MPILAKIVTWTLSAFAVAAAMDIWAGFLHRHFWHGVLWRVHASHHDGQRKGFEANDVLSMTHAPIAVALVLYGCRAAPGLLREMLFGCGVGMTVFGVAYVVVHDGLAHGRLPVRALVRVPLLGAYLRRVVVEHLRHHERPAHGSPYGLFFIRR